MEARERRKNVADTARGHVDAGDGVKVLRLPAVLIPVVNGTRLDLPGERDVPLRPLWARRIAMDSVKVSLDARVMDKLHREDEWEGRLDSESKLCRWATAM